MLQDNKRAFIFGQRTRGSGEDGAHQHVADLERVTALNGRVVIAGLLEQLDQPEIAVILGVRRPF